MVRWRERENLFLMQADKGDQTGYDIILEKHLNGKFVMKDMMEFFRERYVGCPLLAVVKIVSCSFLTL